MEGIGGQPIDPTHSYNRPVENDTNDVGEAANNEASANELEAVQDSNRTQGKMLVQGEVGLSSSDSNELVQAEQAEASHQVLQEIATEVSERYLPGVAPGNEAQKGVQAEEVREVVLTGAEYGANISGRQPSGQFARKCVFRTH